jgi:HD superfamily phosphohydrolase
LDYLLRDSHFAGVKYGIYDLERIINTVRRYTNKAEDRLAFDEEGLQAVEQLVLARHHMMSQVYMHKTRLITDRMIERGLEIAIKNGIIEQPYFEYGCNNGFVERYLSLDDQLLSDKIISHEKKTNASVLFRCLRERKLLKNSFEIVLDIEHLGSIGIRDDPVIYRLSLIEPADAAWIESRVADKLKDLDRELIILDVIEQKTPSSSKGAFMNPDDILFITKENEARTFKRLTNSVFSSKLFEPPTTKIALYLPIDGKRRDELKEILKRDIMPEILRNLYESDSEAQHKLT